MPGIKDDGSLPITFVELEEGFEHDVVYRGHGITVEARPIEHRVFCAGYRYQEDTRPGSLDGDRARAAGVTEGRQFEALKRGDDVTLADGTVVASAGLVGPPRPGAAFAYVLDTMPCDGGRLLADDADLLMHEATFTEAHADRAAEVGHSTARQAAEIARDRRRRAPAPDPLLGPLQRPVAARGRGARGVPGHRRRRGARALPRQAVARSRQLLRQCPGDEGLEVTQTLGDDGPQDRQAERLVIVDGHVAEADHLLHPLAQVGRERAGFREQMERVAAGLGDAQPVRPRAAHGEVDGGLARPLEV